jgi:hypothetical protein
MACFRRCEGFCFSFYGVWNFVFIILCRRWGTLLVVQLVETLRY